MMNLIQQVCLVAMNSEKTQIQNFLHLRKGDIKATFLTIDQWLCLLELHGIVPSKKAKQSVIATSGKWQIGVDSG